MAQQFDALNDKLTDFIQQQKIYFVGTATEDSHVNVSPLSARNDTDLLCV